ncbi:hypothetical protein [Nostoc sp.]|uniref:hypothetical protein n=1 Tax=Nostoc sp. TaxID=1180 RepID=UPI002FF66617
MLTNFSEISARNPFINTPLITPPSLEAIAQIIDTDEYEVEEVLENWLEFLQQQGIAPETHYSLYHSNFRDWLGRQQIKPSENFPNPLY